jgi:hypothetical protein
MKLDSECSPKVSVLAGIGFILIDDYFGVGSNFGHFA